MTSINKKIGYTFISNSLDTILFNELYDSSLILQSIDQQGQYLFDSFGLFMTDFFLLLYKKILTRENMDFTELNGHLIEFLQETPQINKVRSRTTGSKYETYIVYKFFMDALFAKLRGSEHIKELNQLSKDILEYELESELISNMINHPDMDQLPEDQFDTLTQEELVHLENIRNTLRKTRNEALSLSDTLNRIIKSAKQVDSESNDTDDFKDLDEAIATAKETQNNDYQNEDMDPDSSSFLEKIEYEMEKATQQQEDNSFIQESPTDASEDAPETTIQASFDSAFKEMILDLEKRSDTEKSQQILKESTFKNRGKHWLSDELVTGDVDELQIIDEKANDTQSSVFESVDSVKGAHSGEGFLSNLADSKEFIHQNNPTSINQLMDQLKKNEDKLIELKKNMSKKLDALHINNILESTINKLDKFNTELESLNIKKEHLNGYSFDEILGFFKKLEEPKMIEFLNKVGKKKALAAKSQYKKQKAREILSDKIILSDDLDNLVDEELLPLALDIEAFENDFIDRFLHENILPLEQINKTSRHKGPIILCYDGSGSMEGDKISETKAHIVAFIEVARIQKRKLIAIQFASANEPLYIQEINPSNVTIETIINLVDAFIRGGTDFEKPLKKAIEYIQTDRYKQADVLFITDGICDINQSFKNQINAIKHEKQFKLYTIIIHGNTYDDYRDIGDISDEVLEIKQRDLSNWNEKISEKIFSI